jgi:hypothetical protein
VASPKPTAANTSFSSAEAEEFYFAAACLVAMIQDVFPAPNQLYPCPVGLDNESGLPTGKDAQWWGFVYSGWDQRPLHPVIRRLLASVSGLSRLREALREPGKLLKGKVIAGRGRVQSDRLTRKLYSETWLIEPDEREPGDSRIWMRPPSAGLAEQLRVAARDLPFPLVLEPDAPTTTCAYSNLGGADPLHVECFKVEQARAKRDRLRNCNQVAAAAVNQKYGTRYKVDQLRLPAHNVKTPGGGWRKRPG